MILNERDTRHEHACKLADSLCTAARTAPKKGLLILLKPPR
jgi:hypothetical protein